MLITNSKKRIPIPFLTNIPRALYEMKSLESDSSRMEPRFYLSILKLKEYLYKESLTGRLSVVISSQDITISTEPAHIRDGACDWANEKYVM